MKHLSGLKPLTSDYNLYMSFQAYLRYELEVVNKNLATAIEPYRVYRLQGEADRLTRLLKLKEIVDGSDK